jgi:SAM-dependent methyltransferase
MNIEERIYEIDDLWKPENIGENDIYRIEYLTNLIPIDVESILDVGCGGGIFINHLCSKKKFNRIVGVDRSNTALKYVNTEKIIADINLLPFSNNEFDLVTCLEVIEHIPYYNFNKVLEELCRVSKKYILISVPNKQNLAASLCKCPICLTKFNPDFHMRSFDRLKLHSLLDNNGFICVKTYNIRQISSYLGLDLVRDALGLRKRVMPWFAICPVCGFQKEHHYLKVQENLPVHKNILRNVIKKIWPKKHDYEWIAALYIKAN